MNLDNEKELLKRAYLNLRTADSIPFPDAVFDEYVRLRDSEGYKLVPVEASDHMKCVVRDFGPDIEDYENMGKHKWEVLCGDIYKAMIGACDD